MMPLQLHIHDIKEWRHEGFAFVLIAHDSAQIIGLPSLKNMLPVINHDQELYLRDATKYDRPLKRRKLFVINFLRQMRTFSN